MRRSPVSERLQKLASLQSRYVSAPARSNKRAQIAERMAQVVLKQLIYETRQDRRKA